MSVYPELEALEVQARGIESFARELAPEEWQRDTRCPPLTTRELFAHTAAGILLTNKILAEPADGPATKDRVSWWGAVDLDSQADVIVEAAQKKAASRDDAELFDWWRSVVEAGLKSFADGPPDRVVKMPTGDGITAADLAATRVVEFGVHSMDLGHATLRGERIDPGAAEIVADVLRGLLGEPLPKGLGWDRRTFILTGTGRRRLEPNERYSLGPLAERFPLIR